MDSKNAWLKHKKPIQKCTVAQNSVLTYAFIDEQIALIEPHTLHLIEQFRLSSV